MAWSETDVGTSFQFDIHMPAVDLAPPTPSSGGQSPVASRGGNWHRTPRTPSNLEGARAIVVLDEQVGLPLLQGLWESRKIRFLGFSKSPYLFMSSTLQLKSVLAVNVGSHHAFEYFEFSGASFPSQ